MAPSVLGALGRWAKQFVDPSFVHVSCALVGRNPHPPQEGDECGATEHTLQSCVAGGELAWTVG
eukprot:CAMPEP_0179202154 /NCGR_PEP_ID=MMETSP0796-20121207/100664_1 /TAXON_ID=73915 /ORGANISM="Pyrodinium bahamense, Strain pbaha01" /LENGTH=63 /DNA_ID=CAMNT_0020906817 /DNA_START=24 /DNA_END=211 /DNA_ORIENTATION=+